MIVGQGVRYMKEYFAREFGADPNFLHDIGMEIKGMEISEYLTKESLAQQGGFGLATKGPQHDEAWLIFMDQVQNLLPTFKDKAEALHYFPMWRTWFSLHGLCKLPWNDISPENNKQTKEPAKVEEHVENYTWIHQGVTGKPTTPQDLLNQSERVYNFQKVFALRMGRVGRKHDYPPYRAMGPVTAAEYESRQDRYDEQLKRLVEIDPEGLSTQEKMAHLRKYREGQYEQLMDAVYQRRGWDANSIPTPEKLHELGMDLPEVLAVVEQAKKKFNFCKKLVNNCLLVRIGQLFSSLSKIQDLYLFLNTKLQKSLAGQAVAYAVPLRIKKEMRMSEPSVSKSELWRERLRGVLTRLRRGLPFGSGVLAAFVAFLLSISSLFNRIN